MLMRINHDVCIGFLQSLVVRAWYSPFQTPVTNALWNWPIKLLKNLVV